MQAASPSTGGTAQAQSNWAPVVVSVAGVGVTIALTVVGFRIAGRRRRADLGNGDLHETLSVLRACGIEARRLAALMGAATAEYLTELARLVPHVEHAVAQHTGRLHEQLTLVSTLMTEVIANPVEISAIEDAHISASALGDIPEGMRMAPFIARVCRQARTTDRLVTAVTDASAEVRRLRN